MFLTKTQLFASLDFWQQACKSGIWVWEACENYQKKSYSNRYIVLGSQGPGILSVPLAKGKNSKKPIQSVSIAYDHDWAEQHIRTIRTNYGSAPFFDFYFEPVREVLLSKPKSLWELNIAANELIIQLLGLSVSLEFTTSFQKHYPESKDWRFSKPVTDSHVSYIQLFEDKIGHYPKPSILDLMFCLGPESALLLNGE